MPEIIVSHLAKYSPVAVAELEEWGEARDGPNTMARSNAMANAKMTSQ